MYRAIVFFDLDHTLLNDDSAIDEEITNAIDELRNNNVLPVISTGRNIYEITNVLSATKIDTIVSGNGANVHLNGKEIFRNLIDKKLVREMIATAEPLGDAVQIMNDKDYRITKHTPTAIKNYQYINAIIPGTDIEDFLDNQDVMMMVVSTVGHDEAYDKFKKYFNITRNTPYSVDVVSKGTSKQSGIEYLLNALNTQIPTFAFGDGLNDLSMLQFVDHPVAMGNGINEAKQVAEFVTTANTDHGIVNGLKHFHLI